jgi:hypothetical protein
MASALSHGRRLGARVQTKPHVLMAEAQAHRYFGTTAKTSLVPGPILAVESDSSSASARTSVLSSMGDARVLLDQKRPDPQREVPRPSDRYIAPIFGAMRTPAPAVAGTADEDGPQTGENACLPLT